MPNQVPGKRPVSQTLAKKQSRGSEMPKKSSIRPSTASGKPKVKSVVKQSPSRKQGLT